MLSLPPQDPVHWLAALAINGLLIALAQRLPLLTPAGWVHAGVLGTLLDLIEIDAGWEQAVEAALGESLTAVVVDDPATGRRALDALRSSDTSGAVIALGVRPAGQPRPAIGEAVRPHARAVRSDVGALLDGLLSSAVRVDDLVEAVDTALGHPDAVVVTGTGDRFGLSGWRVGAAGGGATAAALDDALERARSATTALFCSFKVSTGF